MEPGCPLQVPWTYSSFFGPWLIFAVVRVCDSSGCRAMEVQSPLWAQGRFQVSEMKDR